MDRPAISRKTANMVQDAYSALMGEIEDIQGEYDSKSEKWIESEVGEEYGEILDCLIEQSDILDALIAELRDHGPGGN